MLQPYGTVRPLLFNGLELMNLRSTSHDAGMEPLIAAVLSLRNQRRELIEVASLGLDPEKDFDWMSKLWRQHVFGKRASAAGARWMHRKYFELAVLVQVKDELKSGDLFIPSSERFDDYREQLVDEATLAQELEAYGQVSGLPTDAASFVAGLRAQLTDLADEVDERFPRMCMRTSWKGAWYCGRGNALRSQVPLPRWIASSPNGSRRPASSMS